MLAIQCRHRELHTHTHTHVYVSRLQKSSYDSYQSSWSTKLNCCHPLVWMFPRLLGVVPSVTKELVEWR